MMPSFVFNDTATTEIYTLSLHDALPISVEGTAIADVWRSVVDRIAAMRAAGALGERRAAQAREWMWSEGTDTLVERTRDRKSTRLNSSHANISYAVFCLKKKNKDDIPEY